MPRRTTGQLGNVVTMWGNPEKRGTHLLELQVEAASHNSAIFSFLVGIATGIQCWEGGAVSVVHGPSTQVGGQSVSHKKKEWEWDLPTEKDLHEHVQPMWVQVASWTGQPLKWKNHVGPTQVQDYAEKSPDVGLLPTQKKHHSGLQNTTTCWYRCHHAMP